LKTKFLCRFPEYFKVRHFGYQRLPFTDLPVNSYHSTMYTVTSCQLPYVSDIRVGETMNYRLSKLNVVRGADDIL
jgi:hypothetical protein